MSTDHALDVRLVTPDRCHEADPTIRTSRVVVPDVVVKDAPEMAARDDEEKQIEALLTRGPHPPLGVAVRAGEQTGVRMTSVPSEAKTPSKGHVNLVSR